MQQDPPPSSNRPPSALTIAGSDSGGGAGIQADLKTFAAFHVHGLSAIAALTAQNTRGVSAVHLPPVEFLAAQLGCLFDDFRITAIKVGMLADAERIECVATALSARPEVPLVLDPVMVASSGARLLQDSAVEALRRLAARATVLTPNLPEAEVLLGRTLKDASDLEDAALQLLELGCSWVLLKGGHLDEGQYVVDRLHGIDGSRFAFRHPRQQVEGHGTGCSLAAAIAASLALGDAVPQACQDATAFLARALSASCRPGLGPLSVLGHFAAGKH